jgi:hypothetical protein
VKGYRKLTLITAMLGLVILVPFVVGYAYVNSLIGLPILGLFLGWLLLYVFLLLIVNIASLYIAFRIKNTKIAGILLIVCGVVILASTNYFGIPSFVLFCIAGVLALRDKPTFSNLIKKSLEVTDPTLQASNGHQEMKVLLISYYQNFHVTGLEEYKPV